MNDAYRCPDGHINNCALANGDEEKNYQVCPGSCPDKRQEKHVNDEIKCGLWRHYKGGLYTVIGTATHHETRLPVVLYVSHTYGGLNVRPLRGWGREGECTDQDGWLDIVMVPDDDNHTFRKVARFTYIGPLPSNTKITER
jgi:hypothetical protein